MELTRDILPFYKADQNDAWYLKKYFTNTLEFGYHYPYAKDAIINKYSGESFLPTVDEINTYEINRFGMRGEVDLDADVLAFGCSITFGIGIPEEGRWTNILSDRMNKSIMNLGNPGASTATICKNIISYCMNNKMPKEIFCLMPDFLRSMVVVDKEFYKSGVKRKNVGTEDHLQLIFCNPKIRTTDNMIFMEIDNKQNIEDATSPHQLILNAIDYMYILESFCLTNNIKLYWTTWDRASSMIMQELSMLEDFKLKNFVPFYPKGSGNQLNPFMKENCILDHNNKFKDHLCWAKGSDYSVINYEKQTQMAHPGIHFQYHVSEFFYNLRNQEGPTE